MTGDIPKEKLQEEKIFVEVEKRKYAAEFLNKSLNKNNFKTI